jgi:hypothetical protein
VLALEVNFMYLCILQSVLAYSPQSADTHKHGHLHVNDRSTSSSRRVRGFTHLSGQTLTLSPTRATAWCSTQRLTSPRRRTPTISGSRMFGCSKMALPLAWCTMVRLGFTLAHPPTHSRTQTHALKLTHAHPYTHHSRVQSSSPNYSTRTIHTATAASRQIEAV